MKHWLLIGLLGGVLAAPLPETTGQYAPAHRPTTTRKAPRPNPPRGRVNHYTNSRGERVQSPTRYAAPPPGASAECRDGTYSFSRSRRGTCSRHGGVKQWLR